jgi:4-amino-4-deoxy-L-arabinose transferase-like glycosyltransferase
MKLKTYLKQLKSKQILFLVFFLSLNLFLRTYQLSQFPYGFHRDEASVGYNAYSILKTGRDEWGQALPLFFKAFGDWPPALILYTTIPSIALFGLNEFSTRLPLAILSTLNLLVIYKILKNLTLKIP